MTTVKEIEKAIAELPPKKLSILKNWFEEFFADQWDKKIEADVKAGKLDFLADEAMAEYKKGKCKEL